MHLDTDSVFYEPENHNTRGNVPVPLIWVQRNIVFSLRINRARIEKMFMQMVDIFEDISLHCARNSDVVNQTNKVEPGVDR